MVFKFLFGQLHVGRPSGILDRYDCAVTLCLRRRRNAAAGALQWRRIWRFAFDWLPIRKYRCLAPIMTTHVPPTAAEFIAGKFAGHEIDVIDTRGTDSSRWTGRDHAFAGFAGWRHSFTSIRSTWRSKVYVYLTGQKERANPRHPLYVTPGIPGLNGMTAAEVPEDWKQPSADGTSMVAKMFEVVFVHGRAEVDERLGEWLIKTGHAQRSPLVRPAGKALLGGLASLIAGR